MSHNIIKAHGGDICCYSETNLTIFKLDLPLSDLEDFNVVDLPSSIKSLNSTLDIQQGTLSDHFNEDENHFEEAIVANNKKIKVLVADDEDFFRKTVKLQILGKEALSKLIEVVPVGTAEETIEKLKEGWFDVVFIDYDFNSGKMNGLDAVKEIRRLGIDVRIWMCFNRCPATIGPPSIAAGAEGFFPKPLPRVHLLKILAGKLKRKILPSSNASLVGKKIILVDDEPLMRETWSKILPEGTLYSFESPESFLQTMREDIELIDNVDLFVLDDNFAARSPKSGFELGKIVRQWKLPSPLALYSNNTYTSKKLAEIFDVALPKNSEQAIRAISNYFQEGSWGDSVVSGKTPSASHISMMKLSKIRHNILGGLNNIEILAKGESELAPGSKERIMREISKTRSIARDIT